MILAVASEPTDAPRIPAPHFSMFTAFGQFHNLCAVPATLA
jgi:hypothetical protein